MSRKKPNIVLFITDQQRADFSREMGYELDPIPTIDHLGKEGIRFTNAYTPCALCYPARCSILTGRFAKAHGAHTNIQGGGIRFEKDLTDVLHEAGYTSVLVGKNHTYLAARKSQPELYMTPEVIKSYGFDYWIETRKREWLPYLKKGKCAQWTKYIEGVRQIPAREPMPFPEEYVGTHRDVSRAINWLKNFRSLEPFFLQISTELPHQPYSIPEPYFSMFPAETIPERTAGPEVLSTKGFAGEYALRLMKHYHGKDYDKNWRHYRQVYLGMLRFIDDQVARFMNYLKSSGLSKNTIVIFISDHGDYVGEYGLIRKGTGVPQCLIQIPMIWTGPGINPHPRAKQAHISLVDILPTICEITGVPIPRGVQGRSLWPILTGKNYCEKEFSSVYSEHGGGGLPYNEEDNPPYDGFYTTIGKPKQAKDDTNVSTSGKWQTVVKGEWKIIYNAYEELELYNIKEDPAETIDLSSQVRYADVFRDMQKELMYWMRRTDDILPLDVWQPKGAEHNWLRDPSKGLCYFDEKTLIKKREISQIHK